MAKLSCRSAFISDVHLGTPDCKAAYLLDFLKNLDCERLYLVGDIVDLEALAKRHWWHPDHSAVIAELIAMAAKGIEVIYLPGNHDFQMRGLAGSTIAGIRVELDAIHEGADGRRYRVSHGDEYDPEHIGRSWIAWLGDNLHRFICWANRRVHAVRKRLELLLELDARHGGSIIDAQIARAVADAPWTPELRADVAAVTTDDFDLVDSGDRDIDGSLDLIAIAVRP